MAPNDAGKTKDGMTTGMKVAMGCAIGAGVCFLLVIAAIVLFALNVKKIGSYVGAQAADKVIDASTLTSGEKTDAKRTAREFLRQTVDGKIPMNDAQAILQRLMEGSVGRFVVFGSVSNAINESGLRPEQKRAATRTVQAFLNGVGHKVFTGEEIQTVLDAIPKNPDASSPGPTGQPGVQPPLSPKPPPWTDEELRIVLARMEDLIEGRAIPPGPAPPIPADELREIIREMKKVMGKPLPPTGAAPPPEMPEPDGR